MKRKNNFKFLVIEDDPYSLEILVEMLNLVAEDMKLQVSIDTATNGEEGIRLFEANKYDIVFTDINMPQKDGYKVFKHMKYLNPSQIILAITGTQLEGRKGTMLLFDFNGYIPKPISYDLLKDEVYKYIS